VADLFEIYGTQAQNGVLYKSATEIRSW